MERGGHYNTKKVLWVFLLSTIILGNGFGVIQAKNSTHLTKQQWLEDLDYVTKTLIDRHPDIFYRMSKDEFKLVVVKAEKKSNAVKRMKSVSLRSVKSLDLYMMDTPHSTPITSQVTGISFQYGCMNLPTAFLLQVSQNNTPSMLVRKLKK